MVSYLNKIAELFVIYDLWVIIFVNADTLLLETTSKYQRTLICKFYKLQPETKAVVTYPETEIKNREMSCNSLWIPAFVV